MYYNKLKNSGRVFLYFWHPMQTQSYYSFFTGFQLSFNRRNSVSYDLMVDILGFGFSLGYYRRSNTDLE